MPKKEIILENVQNLRSLYTLEPDPDRAEIWVGKSYGARFNLTKEVGKVLNKKQTTVTLYLRGKQRGQSKLMDDFISALGQPAIVSESIRSVKPKISTWVVSEIADNPDQITQSK